MDIDRDKMKEWAASQQIIACSNGKGLRVILAGLPTEWDQVPLWKLQREVSAPLGVYGGIWEDVVTCTNLNTALDEFEKAGGTRRN